jgi:hypothetical protein
LVLFPRAALSQRPPLPESGQGYQILNEGNSLMGQLHTRTVLDEDGKRVELLPGMQQQLGYPETMAEGVGAAGVPIDWIWTTPHKREEFYNDLAARDWDLFVVQPFGYQNTRRPEDEAAAAAQMYREVVKRYPKAALLVYQTWPAGRPHLGDGGGDAKGWLEELDRAIETHMNPVGHILRQEFPDKPVYVIPVPQALGELTRRIEKSGGDLLGIKHIAEMLDTGGSSVHLSRKGVFLNVMVHLSSYMQESMVDKRLPIDYETVFAFNLQEGMQPPGLTQAQAKLLQQIAWEVVSTYPATTVSGKEFQLEDSEPPVAASFTESTLAGPGQMQLVWSPATDNREVTGYSIYLGGEYLATISPDERDYLVAGLTPGEQNRVTVRAWDAVYNFADAVVDVTPPAIEGDVLLGWDLSPYSNRPEDKRPDEKIRVTENAEGIQVPAPIVRGKGLDSAKRPWRHVMYLSGIEADTLDAAVEESDYVTMTVAPEPRQKVSLSALKVPIKVEGDSLRVTVFSSPTGFEPENALADYRLENGLQRIIVPLADHEPLQAIAGPVELRLHLWHSDRGAMLGHFGDPREQLDVILLGRIGKP